jgi:hypothetical protein
LTLYNGLWDERLLPQIGDMLAARLPDIDHQLSGIARDIVPKTDFVSSL